MRWNNWLDHSAHWLHTSGRMKPSLIACLVAPAVLLASMTVAHAESDEPLSPTTATLLSLGGVAASGLTLGAGLAMGGDAGIAVGIVGASSLLITPSAGNIYSGKFLSRGFVARVAGTAAMAGGAALFVASFDPFNESDDHAGAAAGMALFVGGGVAFVTGTILDVATASTAAHEWNAKHGFTLAPTPIVTPSGTSAGLGLSGRF